MNTAAWVWCDRKWVVTSPHIGRYSNGASSGDVGNEITLEKKPKR